MRFLASPFSQLTLRARISLAAMGLTLALGVVAMVYAILSLTAILEERLENLGVAIAKDLAARSAAPSQTNDVFALYEVFNDSVLNNNDVRYIFLVEPSGEVRAHTFENGVPPGLIDANMPDVTERQRVRELKTNEGSILDIAVPVLEGQGGVIRVGMSAATVKSRVMSRVSRQSWIVGVAVLVAIVLSYLVSALLTRPLSRVTDAVRKAGGGDPGSEGPTRRGDDVGDLARAFDTMAEDILRSRENLIQRNTELEILDSMAGTLGRQLAGQHVLQDSLDRLLELTQFSAAWVCTKTAEGRMRLSACQGIATPSPWKSEAEPKACCCLNVIETGRGVGVQGTFNCPLVLIKNQAADAVRSHAIVPLGSREGAVGVLAVASPEAEEFDEGRMWLLASIGQQMGIALENATLYEEMGRKERVRTELLDKVIEAQEEERKRIAREIHDEPTQVLSGVLMQLDTIERRLAGEREMERREIERVRPSVRAAIESLQRITTELRPQALDDLGFVPAIRWYAQQRLGDTGVNVALKIAGRPGRLPTPIELAVFRITQEAINNVAKHAEATNVRVQLMFDNGVIRGQIEDDGAGFDPPSAGAMPSNGSGLGLLGMQERAVLLGGSFSITSKRGQGTRVSFEIPLPEGG